MAKSLRKQDAATDGISNREMVFGLQSALERNYGRILQAAGNEWERRFAANDPSDACVTVRISSWSPTLAVMSPQIRAALPSFTS